MGIGKSGSLAGDRLKCRPWVFCEQNGEEAAERSLCDQINGKQ